MKKALPYIFLLLTVVNLFAPFSVGINQQNTATFQTSYAEAADCKIVSATLDPHGGQGTYIASVTGKTVTLTLNTTGCIGQMVNGSLIERDPVIALGNNSVIDFPKQKITANTVTLAFKAGESHCEGGECEIFDKVFVSDAKTGANLDVFTSDNPTELDYYCQVPIGKTDPSCNTDINWVQTAAGTTGVTQTIQFTANQTNPQKNSITISGTGPQGGDVRTDDNIVISIANQSTGALMDAGAVGGKNPITLNVVNQASSVAPDGFNRNVSYTATFTGLAPATTYTITVTPTFASDTLKVLNVPKILQAATLDANGQQIAPLASSTPTDALNQAQNQGDNLPVCWKGFSDGFISFPGCMAQLLYYVLFMPTSFIFALMGKFFDWTFAYSVSDVSYRSTFVVQGWGIVRDFCNMFFIFVLLYIAFATILGVGGHFRPGKMIVTVIVVGLFINFSLFTTQVIIDASNILARVFYNDSAIKVTQGTNAANCVTTATNDCASIASASAVSKGPNGEIQLSAALVNKVNPQNLIINAKTVGSIADGKANTGAGIDAENLGTGTFILVTILAVAVNIVGIFVFLMVGMIFVSRVIGLWFAMIFSPLMFFSYTVPGLESMELFGNKKWWPETLKLAFLAPVFIFFLYLILKFLNTGLDLIHAAGASGIDFVMSIIIPFVFIMVLLLKAKDIASSMSGKMAQSITGGVAAVGSLALGGAALGAAVAGRKTVGAVSKYTQNDGARHNALTFKDTREAASKIKGINALNPFAYLNVAGKAISGAGKAAMAGLAVAPSYIGRETDPHTGKTTNWFQRQTGTLGKKAHAIHALDEAAQAVTHDKSAKFKDLTESEQQSVKDKIDRDIVAKERHNKPYDKITKPQRDAIDAEKGTTAVVNGRTVFTRNPNGTFSHAAELAQQRAAAKGDHVHTAADMTVDAKAPTAISEFVNALRKGSYDVRNLSQTKSISGGFAKAGIGIISAVATGVRTGLKASNINHGSGQGEFIKDLGHTLKEAMQSAKIKVKVEESHGHSAHEAEHGGGHGGGGHH